MNLKRYLIAVCGGIAAYKTAELVRLLVKSGAEVRVVMTDSATRFITPLTFQALSGNPVSLDLLDSDAESAMGHIRLARWADVFIIAPATANSIAKFSHGLADDLVSALYLAAECPVFIAPAMNQAMWNQAVTRENVSKLRAVGVHVVGPEAGSQACGEVGPGRMTEPDAIVAAITSWAAGAEKLQGKTVLISAGPTREAIDPVRFISNRSSGKMGYALAQVAAEMGAKVVLVSGPVALSAPPRTELIGVESAEQMYEAVMARADSSDAYIGAAAVADYTPSQVRPEKIKKQHNQTTLELIKTQDILAAVAAISHRRPYTVGFAAETNDLDNYALTKLAEKGADMIAANWVGRDVGGFESDMNALKVFWSNGTIDIPMMEKNALARRLLDLIAEKMG